MLCFFYTAQISAHKSPGVHAVKACFLAEIRGFHAFFEIKAISYKFIEKVLDFLMRCDYNNLCYLCVITKTNPCLMADGRDIDG